MTAAPLTGPEQADAEDGGHLDVLIVGAGVSGIGAAHHLRDRFPDRSFLVLDAQDNRGGTWWTHRYPGVRSDSDLFTYGYRFKPWHGPSIAAGKEILASVAAITTPDDERILQWPWTMRPRHSWHRWRRADAHRCTR